MWSASICCVEFPSRRRSGEVSLLKAEAPQRTRLVSRVRDGVQHFDPVVGRVLGVLERKKRGQVFGRRKELGQPLDHDRVFSVLGGDYAAGIRSQVLRLT